MTAVTDLKLAEIDLTSGGLAGDNYHQRLAEVASQGEVGWLASSPLAYVVLDRDAAEFFLRAKATAFPGREIADLFGVTSGRLREVIDANILNQQGDRHRRLRSLVSGAFTPRAADRWRPVMRGFLGRLWAAIEADRGCEFVEAVARPYPSLTIATVLGAPEADAPRLQVWSTLIQRQFDIQALSTQLAELEQAAAEAYDYIENLLTQRAGQPGDDLLTQLLGAEEAGDKLSHAECVNLVLDVIAGGVDTTQAQLGHALRMFASHPQQWQAIRADHASHRADMRRAGRVSRRAIPDGHDRRGLLGARQPPAARRRGLRHHRAARRAAADVRRRSAFLPGQ